MKITSAMLSSIKVHSLTDDELRLSFIREYGEEMGKRIYDTHMKTWEKSAQRVREEAEQDILDLFDAMDNDE